MHENIEVLRKSTDATAERCAAVNIKIITAVVSMKY